jgi:phosphate transport system protein
MNFYFQHELEKIRSLLAELGGDVAEALSQVICAVATLNLELALAVREGDHKIDLREIEIEEECLKTLALYQPVASDLRNLVAAIKINNDLERIGDMAVNIARSVRYFKSYEKPGLEQVRVPDFSEMAQLSLGMFRESLDAMLRLDSELATKVLESDDGVDNMHKAILAQIEESIQSAPEHTGYLMRYATISRSLERVADHATNIAEDVLYMVQGRILRHHRE